MDPTIALAVLAVCSEVTEVVANMPDTFAPVQVQTGCDGYNEKAQIALADDPKSWNEAWLTYRVGPALGNRNTLGVTANDAPPGIDFDHNFVVVVFGPLSSVSGYQVEDSFTKGKEVHVRLRPTPLTTSATISLKVNPYGFFVFPRTKLPIDVEFPTMDSNGNESWQVAAKLPPPRAVDNGSGS